MSEHAARVAQSRANLEQALGFNLLDHFDIEGRLYDFFSDDRSAHLWGRLGAGGDSEGQYTAVRDGPRIFAWKLGFDGKPHWYYIKPNGTEIQGNLLVQNARTVRL